MDKRFWRALGVFAGGVIGAGVFGLPAALVRAGLLVFLLHVVVVAVLVWWLHRCYLTVVLATPGKHRLPGYARIHLGLPAFALTAAVNIFGLVGALVAYLIAGSGFLYLILEALVPLTSFTPALLYLLPGALLLLIGVRALPAIELLILGLFLLILAAVPLAASEYVSFTRIPLGGPSQSLFLPYGVLLFSYWGVSLIPETSELARKQLRRTLRVLTLGLLLAVVTYVVFALAIAGITGPFTTEDALTGLRSVLGNGVVQLALLFGLLTTFSSYLALGLTLIRTLMLDFRVPRLSAWMFTVLVPLFLVVAGVRGLLTVLAVTGAVFLGIEGLVVLAMYRHVSPRATRRTPWSSVGLAIAAVLLVIGVVGELFRSLLLS